MNNFRLIIYFLTSSLLFITCSKDNDEPQNVNGELIIDGETYGLSHGSIVNMMEYPDSVYHYGITLLSSGIRINPEVGYAGYGELIFITLMSENWDLPDYGTYPLELDSEGLIPGNTRNIYIYTGYQPEFEEATAEQIYACTDGSVVFNMDGNEFEFTVEAVGIEADPVTQEIIGEDIEITMHFKGMLLKGLYDEEPE